MQVTDSSGNVKQHRFFNPWLKAWYHSEDGLNWYMERISTLKEKQS